MKIDIIHTAQNASLKYSMPDAHISYKAEGRNCSEELYIYMKLDQERIVEWSFDGTLSLTSTAGAQVFGEFVKGKNISEVLTWRAGVMDRLLGEVPPRQYRQTLYGLVATKNALHHYLGDGVQEDIFDVMD